MDHRIVEGKMVENCKKDFFVVNAEEKQEVSDKFIECAKRLLWGKNYNYTIDDVQIICPQRISEIGVEAINKRMQELVNSPSPSKQEIVRGETIFRLGDKVLHTANAYTMQHYMRSFVDYIEIVSFNGEPCVGVFNGDFGKIIDFKKELIKI